MNSTLAFYEDNAAEITRKYEEVDFDGPVERFARSLPPGAKILEIGSGSGRDAALMLKLGLSVTGLDGSERMIREAIRLHPELADKLIHCILPSPLPFVDHRFDAAMSWAVLMHLPSSDLSSVFKEIARVIVPGGLFVYSVNSRRSGLDVENRDNRGRRFTCMQPAGWEELHKAAGFETVETVESDDITGRPGIRWVTVWARRPIDES